MSPKGRFREFPSELTWEVVDYSPHSLFDAYLKNSTAVEIWLASVEKKGLGKIQFKFIDEDGGEGFKNVTVEIMNATERPTIDLFLQSPENGTIIGNTSANLSWSADKFEGIIAYDVYFGDSVDNISLKYEVLKVTNVDLSGLIEGTTYYCKVTATSEGIPTVFESEIWHFVIQVGFTPIHKIEVIESEIELHPSVGITQAELERLSLAGSGGAPPGAAPFQGRLAKPLQYTLPSQQTYQHKPLTAAHRVTSNTYRFAILSIAHARKTFSGT